VGKGGVDVGAGGLSLGCVGAGVNPSPKAVPVFSPEAWSSQGTSLAAPSVGGLEAGVSKPGVFPLKFGLAPWLSYGLLGNVLSPLGAALLPVGTVLSPFTGGAGGAGAAGGVPVLPISP
jgi:hypothetical protein